MSKFDPECIDVEDFFDCLGIVVARQVGEQIYFHCPFPNHSNGDATASATMHAETTAFFCYGCKEKGNAVHFAAKLLEISMLEAIRMLKARYSPGGIDPDARNMIAEVERVLNPKADELTPQPRLDESALDRFAVDWPEAWMAWKTPGWESFPACDYMFERGFEPGTLDDWNFGYDEISNRVTFAVRDFDGTLIGFKARAIDDRHPKYLVLGDKPNMPPRYGWPCYHTSRVVFGADRCASESEIIICEGELNVVALWQMGHKAVAINGSHFSDHHARIIRRITDKAILFFDNDPSGEDKAGHEVTMRVIESLSPFMPVMVVPPHEGDPASLPADQVGELLRQIQPGLLLAL